MNSNLGFQKMALHTGTKLLTHWGRQATIRTKAGLLLIGTIATNYSEIVIEVQRFSFKKMYLKISWRPFCLGLNVLINEIKQCKDDLLLSLRTCRISHKIHEVDELLENVWWNTIYKDTCLQEIFTKQVGLFRFCPIQYRFYFCILMLIWYFPPQRHAKSKLGNKILRCSYATSVYMTGCIRYKHLLKLYIWKLNTYNNNIYCEKHRRPFWNAHKNHIIQH